MILACFGRVVSSVTNNAQVDIATCCAKDSGDVATLLVTHDGCGSRGSSGKGSGRGSSGGRIKHERDERGSGRGSSGGRIRYDRNGKGGGGDESSGKGGA